MITDTYPQKQKQRDKEMSRNLFEKKIKYLTNYKIQPV